MVARSRTLPAGRIAGDQLTDIPALPFEPDEVEGSFGAASAD